MADKRFTELSIPRDADGRVPAVGFGYDPVLDVFYPLAVTDLGDGRYKLQVEAAFSGSISIGNVSIKDAVGTQLASVDADGHIMAYADDNPLKKANITSEYTYVASGYGVGKVETIKEYPTGASGGSPAKLTTYSYNVDNKVISIVVTDTTV